MLASTGVVAQTTWFVDAAATGANSGASWSDALVDLQSALNAVSIGDSIWVAEGVYKPDSGTMNNSLSFGLRSGVQLLGGFAGTETAEWERDPTLHPTVLSGDLLGDDDPETFLSGMGPHSTDNSDHVVVGIDVDSTCRLDGFIITGGAGREFDGACDPWVGGGLALRDSNPVIRCCKFVLNRSEFRGGGCFLQGSEATFEHCEFRQNLGRFNGGGAMALCASDPFIIDSRFEDNRAAQGAGAPGGAIYANDSSPHIRNCSFVANRAYGGGALAAFDDSDPIVEGSLFIANTAVNSAGIAFDASEFRSSPNGIVRDCVFVGNTAGFAIGTIGIWTGSARIENCTIVSNACGTRDGPGGIMLAEAALNPSVVVRNCILWGNSAAGIVDEQSQIWDDSFFFDIAIDHCCIEGWTGGLGGTGNFALDPQLLDLDGPDDLLGTEDDDARLASTSPCVDSGNPDVSDGVMDCFGVPRNLDGDLDGAMVPDIGAAEFTNVMLSAALSGRSDPAVKIDVQSSVPMWGFLAVGVVPGNAVVPPLGALLIAPTSGFGRLVLGPLPFHKDLTISAAVALPRRVLLQAVGLEPGGAVGNFSNLVSLDLAGR